MHPFFSACPTDFFQPGDAVVPGHSSRPRSLRSSGLQGRALLVAGKGDHIRETGRRPWRRSSFRRAGDYLVANYRGLLKRFDERHAGHSIGRQDAFLTPCFLIVCPSPLCDASRSRRSPGPRVTSGHIPAEESHLSPAVLKHQKTMDCLMRPRTTAFSAASAERDDSATGMFLTGWFSRPGCRPNLHRSAASRCIVTPGFSAE